MTTQYWLGGFFVDLSRNQITHNGQTLTLAPKALAVLTYLAKRRGEVVSHDELLDAVWQNTVVSPNTLQKSIAQLRKALGDDGKVQIYIKTHAKKGYSLECEVRWQSNESLAPAKHIDTARDQASDAQQVPSTAKVTRKSKLLTAMCVIIAAGILTYTIMPQQTNTKITFSEIHPLTATDDKEFSPSYSPDGKYVVFHRYLDKQCKNQLWAKDSVTQQETLLTQDWAAYGDHNFSHDGKKLVFIETNACGEAVTQNECYNLVTLDFEKALESAQQPVVVQQCVNSTLKMPIWLNNKEVALMQSTSGPMKLIKYSIDEHTSQELFSINNGNLIYFSYSKKYDLLAVITVHEDDAYYLEMLRPNGHIISSNKLLYPPEIPKYHRIYPRFHPQQKQLIFSTGKQLFTLSFDGQIEKLSVPLMDRMMLPVFHPSGEKLLMIKGPYDSDIIKLSMDELRTSADEKSNYKSFTRSNHDDDKAKFQPGGELIAFLSNRSGDTQIWLSDTKRTYQLTQFPIDNYIYGFDWAQDGKRIMASVNRELVEISLDGTVQKHPLNTPAMRLFQWNSDAKTALMLTRIKGITQLVEYNFATNKLTQLSDKQVVWAQKSAQNQLIYQDQLGQFWRSGALEDRRIRQIDGYGLGADMFVLKNNTIYSVNSQKQVWSYNLNNDKLEILGTTTKEADRITDINQNELLLSVTVAAKKEVVELVLDN